VRVCACVQVALLNTKVQEYVVKMGGEGKHGSETACLYVLFECVSVCVWICVCVSVCVRGCVWVGVCVCTWWCMSTSV